MKPYAVPLPEDSLLASSLDRVDYFDAFGIKTMADVSLISLPPLFFQAFPSWFLALMYLRELIAGLIGLKTSKGMDVKKQLKEFKGEEGEAIALFRVLGRTEEEILTGEHDAHLDFRLSFFARKLGKETELILATTVQFNGLLGKMYFLPVRPVHRLIVPIILKRMVRIMERKTLISSTNKT